MYERDFQIFNTSLPKLRWKFELPKPRSAIFKVTFKEGQAMKVIFQVTNDFFPKN